MDKTIEPSEGPVKHIAIPVTMPATLVLCVYTDADGKLWPATGFNLVKNLDAADLETMGIECVWQHPDGTSYSREAIDTLMTKRLADVQTGVKCVPTGTV